MHEPEHVPHVEDTFGEAPLVAPEIVASEDFLPPVPPPRPRRRRVWLPIFLFVATCLSTFFVGLLTFSRDTPNFQGAMVYMASLMGILLAHEMGHFLLALRYRIPASLPFFIPIPIKPIGTMGAVIGMQGSIADRKQMFDIGLAGPLAGLIVAIPVTWFGIQTAEQFVRPAAGIVEHFADPLLVTFLIQYLRPELPAGAELTLNPLLLAGWVGMLITGLNMVPISQLDGGHVSYALFGRRAHLIARGFLLFVIAYMIINDLYVWTLMVILVLIIGTDHPPTADDNARIGPLRWVVGFASLAIPVFCLTPRPWGMTQF